MLLSFEHQLFEASGSQNFRALAAFSDSWTVVSDTQLAHYLLVCRKVKATEFQRHPFSLDQYSVPVKLFVPLRCFNNALTVPEFLIWDSWKILGICFLRVVSFMRTLARTIAWLDPWRLSVSQWQEQPSSTELFLPNGDWLKYNQSPWIPEACKKLAKKFMLFDKAKKTFPVNLQCIFANCWSYSSSSISHAHSSFLR